MNETAHDIGIAARRWIKIYTVCAEIHRDLVSATATCRNELVTNLDVPGLPLKDINNSQLRYAHYHDFRLGLVFSQWAVTQGNFLATGQHYLREIPEKILRVPLAPKDVFQKCSPKCVTASIPTRINLQKIHDWGCAKPHLLKILAVAMLKESAQTRVSKAAPKLPSLDARYGRCEPNTEYKTENWSVSAEIYIMAGLHFRESGAPN
ncbi:hypothetical protein J6590_083989 [Homalodisca vitripennis]|nr:hypothetical protein J6590_083989 [Homalodisca vitripennis]